MAKVVVLNFSYETKDVDWNMPLAPWACPYDPNDINFMMVQTVYLVRLENILPLGNKLLVLSCLWPTQQ
jgi:hypothetical protein